MLMNPKRTLRAGDPVVINLEFRGGLVLPVPFEVRKGICVAHRARTGHVKLGARARKWAAFMNANAVRR